jgi:3-hydroxyacyl-CoA dehydrogenase
VSQPGLPERLAIAGGGAVACGLARLAAKVGGDVAMLARSPESAERIRAVVPGEVRVETDPEALREATFVVEAVIEHLPPKAAVYERLAPVLCEDAIVASSTSSLSIEELAAASGRPHRFAGFHVFHPVERMELVELAFPEEAAEDTRTRVVAVAEALGKTAVEVPCTPGFVVNRLLFPYLFDAVRLLERSGMEPTELDRCMKLGAGHPMGPLALLDFVGLDVALAIGEELGLDVPERLRELADAGRLGRKAGAGFYEYGEG